MDLTELITTFLAGSRWVWITVAVVGAIAVTVRVMGW
jgi:uncharacterized protein involved in exopolysaccharide biosynthesis